MKLKNRLALLAPLFGILCVSSAHAQIVSKRGGYSMRVHYVKNQKLIYVMSTSTGPTPGKGPIMSMTLSQLVTSVSKGVATIQMRTGALMLNGKPAGKPGDPSFIQIDNHNGLVSGNNRSLAPKLPNDVVKVGESFSAVIPISGLNFGGLSRLIARYTFHGMTVRRGRRVAELDLDLVRSSASPNGNGKIYMLASDGTAFDGWIKMDLTSLPKNSGLPKTVYISITRK